MVDVDFSQFSKDMQTIVRNLEAIGHDVNARDLAKMQTKALNITKDAMKDNITDLDGGKTFKVYKKGGLYAEIKPGQLKKSIGIMTSRVSNRKLFSSKSVGPKVKGVFNDPERGGWFAHFMNYGYLLTSSGLYDGKNKGFADKAKASTYNRVILSFRNDANSYVNKIIKSKGL